MYMRCRHIMPNGVNSQSPALRHKPFCYFHNDLHCRAKECVLAGDQPLKLPLLEDRSAIQLAVFEILDALVSSRLDARRAGLYLYGLQLAPQNIDRTGPIHPTTSVVEVERTRAGNELSPRKIFCAFGVDDCTECDFRRYCGDCPLEDDEEDKEEEDDEDAGEEAEDTENTADQPQAAAGEGTGAVDEQLQA